MGWFLLLARLAWSQPTDAPTTHDPQASHSELRVQVSWSEDSAWAHQVWQRTVRRLQRRWRRATRRSDEPIDPPELPTPGEHAPVTDASLLLEGEDLIGGPLEEATGGDGTARFRVPAGAYRLTVVHMLCRDKVLEDIVLLPGQVETVRVWLEEHSDADVITHRGTNAPATCRS